MPPDSPHVDEEGVLLDNVQLVAEGRFLEDEMRAILAGGRYPSRNVDQNLADLRAQVAACAKGAEELAKMVEHFGLPVVRAYMRHVQDNAEEAVRRVLDVLKDGHFEYEMDSGARIVVTIRIDKPRREATVDFTGTSAQQPTNFNAPSAVCKAAVLYVFRTLVDDEIPMNAGCLKPLRIVIPEGSMLSPRYPAAVVAGNVETSQTITDALYGALGVLAASQGTMNNFTFGNDTYQYYETIAGGAGAGPGLRRRERGADAHDQLAAHRPRGARVALPGAARVVRDPPRQRRRGPPPRRRRRAPRVRFLEDHDRGDARQPPARRAVRRGGRRAGRGRAQLGRARRRHARGIRRHVQGRHARGRRLRHRDAGRRRLRRAGDGGARADATVGVDWVVGGARADAPLAERTAWLEHLSAWVRSGVDSGEGSATPATRLRFLLQVLERNPERQAEIARLLRDTLREMDAVALLCETGLPRAHAFLHELFERMAAKLFPAVPPPNDLAALFRRLFPRESDGDWIAALPPATLAGIASLIASGDGASGPPRPLQDAGDALAILASHVQAIGMSHRVRRRTARERPLDSPFATLSSAVHDYLETPPERPKRPRRAPR